MSECRSEGTVIALAPHATALLRVWVLYTCGCGEQYSIALPSDLQDYVIGWMEDQREVAAAQMEAWR